MRVAFLLTLFLRISAHASETSCIELSDNYCQQLYSEKNQGILENINLGRTKNDIKYSKYYFLKAVIKSIGKQSKDVQQALARNQIPKKLNNYINRKSRSELTTNDIFKDEWSNDLIEEIRTAFKQVAVNRTEKLIPGYIRHLVKDTNPESDLQYYRQLDLIWADFFQNVWKEDPAWKEVEKKFEIVRKEYLDWNAEDKTISNELRQFRNDQLNSLSLVIPGSVKNRAYDASFRCGIDEDNAFYNSSRHQLTICAGAFVGNEPILTIGHEVGHAISNGRRIYKYIEASPFGKKFVELWNNLQKGNHLSCTDWESLKKGIEKDLIEMPSYNFDDKLFLSQFLSKELRAIPKDPELRRITDRSSKRTLNDEIRSNIISRILKKTTVLESGRSVQNNAYLNPEALTRWPILPISLFSPSAHFDHFFTEEYNCRLNEKKISETKALEESLVEARRLVGISWKMLLTVSGPFSMFRDAIDEEFAQDIEEDVVDSYASTVVARIIKKIELVEERRSQFLKATASYCDPISFRQLYPAETNVMHKFTNALHSIGQDRRRKLLTDDLKPLLQCK